MAGVMATEADEPKGPDVMTTCATVTTTWNRRCVVEAAGVVGLMERS